MALEPILDQRFAPAGVAEPNHDRLVHGFGLALVSGGSDRNKVGKWSPIAERRFSMQEKR